MPNVRKIIKIDVKNWKITIAVNQCANCLKQLWINGTYCLTNSTIREQKNRINAPSNKNDDAPQNLWKKKEKIPDNPENSFRKNSTEFFRSLFAFYEQLVKVRVVEKNTSLFLSCGRWEKRKKKMANGRRKREFYFQIARARFLFFYRQAPKTDEWIKWNSVEFYWNFCVFF